MKRYNITPANRAEKPTTTLCPNRAEAVKVAKALYGNARVSIVCID